MEDAKFTLSLTLPEEKAIFILVNLKYLCKFLLVSIFYEKFEE